MDDNKYKELLFEATFGHKVDIIDPILREEVLNQISDKFQQKAYDEYKKQYPNEGSMDIYFFQKLINSDKPQKDVDYEKLYLISSRIGKIKEEMIVKQVK
jgi:hypothetical protein